MPDGVHQEGLQLLLVLAQQGQVPEQAQVLARFSLLYLAVPLNRLVYVPHIHAVFLPNRCLGVGAAAEMGAVGIGVDGLPFEPQCGAGF